MVPARPSAPNQAVLRTGRPPLRSVHVPWRPLGGMPAGAAILIRTYQANVDCERELGNNARVATR